MQAGFHGAALLLTGVLIGAALWPIAERFEAVPVSCYITQDVYDAAVKNGM